MWAATATPPQVFPSPLHRAAGSLNAPSGCRGRCVEPTFYCLVYGGMPVDPSLGEEGVAEVTVRDVPMKPPALATLKSNNYLLNCLTAMSAGDRGGHFGVLVDENGMVPRPSSPHPVAHAFAPEGLESRHLESRAKASARLVLEVSAGWASPFSRGLCGGDVLLLSTGAAPDAARLCWSKCRFLLGDGVGPELRSSWLRCGVASHCTRSSSPLELPGPSHGCSLLTTRLD